MTECGQCGGAAAAAAAPLYTDTIISLTEFLRLPSVQCPGVHHLGFNTLEFIRCIRLCELAQN